MSRLELARHRRGTIALLLLVFVGFGAWRGPAVLRYLTTEREWFSIQLGSEKPQIGWIERNSLRPAWSGTSRSWFAETGTLARCTDRIQESGGEILLVTYYEPGGKVENQLWVPCDRNGDATGPLAEVTRPWRKGYVDQEGRSAPWLERGLTADEWWAEVRR